MLKVRDYCSQQQKKMQMTASIPNDKKYKAGLSRRTISGSTPDPHH